MRKTNVDWNLVIDIGLALKDTLAHNFRDLLQAILIGPASKEVVKMVGLEYKGAQALLTARLLSKRTPDGAFVDGPVAVGYFKAGFKKFPPKRKPVLAFEGSPHTADDFDGVIESGYGKGIKTLLYTGEAIVKRNTWRGPEITLRKINIHLHKADRAGKHYDLVVTGVKPGEKMFEMHTTTSGKWYDESLKKAMADKRFAFVRPEGKMYKKNYLLCVPMKDKSIVLPKPVFRSIGLERLQEIDAEPGDWIAEWKPDGGLAIANIEDGRAIFTSHREQAPAYYDKLPHAEWLYNRSPFITNRLLFPTPDVDGTVLYVELFHPEGAARVGGILNANADNSIRLQQERGPITVIVWDIAKYKGKDVSHLPYAERRVLMQEQGTQIARINKYWSVVPSVEGGGFMKFYKRIVSDKRGLPYSEGIMLKRGSDVEQVGYKVKHRDTYDVEVVEILEGEGKYKGSAGKMVVRSEPGGALGEVGSLAVPDEQRDWIWRHRNKVVGQVAEIHAQEITKAGLPRAGVFLRWHPGKSDYALKMYK